MLPCFDTNAISSLSTRIVSRVAWKRRMRRDIVSLSDVGVILRIALRDCMVDIELLRRVLGGSFQVTY